MTASFVDVTSLQAVTEILTATVERRGVDGLLVALPPVEGLQVVPAGRGLLGRPTTGRVLFGDQLVEATPTRAGVRLVQQHIVGGITLSHQPLAAARFAAVLAGWFVQACTAASATGRDAAIVALTSLRDVLVLEGAL